MRILLIIFVILYIIIKFWKNYLENNLKANVKFHVSGGNPILGLFIITENIIGGIIVVKFLLKLFSSL